MAFDYPVSRPQLSGRELELLTEAVESGWISSQGPFVREFEERFAAYNGYPHGVACSSGTTALTLALRALRIGAGDEVIVPEFTWVSTAWAVSYTGATPVFVDCGDDLNIDVTAIEDRITPWTKAIMPVNVYGRRCDMDAIMRIAYEYNLRVVEDSSEAHGVRPVGDIACFSLFANKIITSGEGGVCVTRDRHLAEQMAHLRGMAVSAQDDFVHKKLAYNFRMTNLQAAVALAQLERIDEFLAIRKRIEACYDAGLSDVDGVTLMPGRDVLWMYDVLVDRPQQLREFLAERGIETRMFFQPMSRQPMYFDAGWSRLKAARFGARGLYLPTHAGLTESDQQVVIGAVREFYQAG
ncbi:MAG TPA: DegT/DnrJ/EryC1/StrS family aminotransferase [Pseudonocardiaceae bacterium]|jgi:dTDP-4-amino-4,6-dideoxygalactose transaminase|nr:DegT/DnrJ/EryC1/StrS family aminotransferase [Pseudonocardiaceae bacterium]